MRLERFREAEKHVKLEHYVKGYAMFPKSSRKLTRVINRCLLTNLYLGREITHIVLGRVDQRWAKVNVFLPKQMITN